MRKNKYNIEKRRRGSRERERAKKKYMYNIKKKKQSVIWEEINERRIFIFLFIFFYAICDFKFLFGTKRSGRLSGVPNIGLDFFYFYLFCYVLSLFVINRFFFFFWKSFFIHEKNFVCEKKQGLMLQQKKPDGHEAIAQSRRVRT